jgi:hypothetical protein
LVSGATGAPSGTDPMNYEAVTVSTEGGLEAVAQEVAGLEDNFVRPQLFKRVVGKGHAEFSSARQQVIVWVRVAGGGCVWGQAVVAGVGVQERWAMGGMGWQEGLCMCECAWGGVGCVL